MPTSRTTFPALALAAALLGAGAQATHAQMVMPAKQDITEEHDAFARLYQLGYPADERMAVQRWRADTGRSGAGPLAPDEVEAIRAQPDPQHFAAFAGNPFQGMGIAVRHKSRAEAEAQAIALCRRQGGGATCTTVHVIPGDQCMFVSGYLMRPGERRPSRGIFIVAPSLEAARERSLGQCRAAAGPVASALCKPMLSFCADGSHMQRLGVPLAPQTVNTR